MTNVRRSSRYVSWLAIAFGIAGLLTCPPLAVAADDDTDRGRVVPLVRAHAHNDYEHDRPLLDALDNGFCNVEADIFLIEGQLLVAHSILEVRKSRTLAKLYLDPLAERVKSNGGRVYRDGPEFALMIDLKSKAEPTYKALAKELAGYSEMLTTVRGGKAERRAVNIVLSGNRPHALVAAEEQRFVGIDGRMSDLDSDAPAHLMPWLSDNWSNHFKWNGRGAMPADELAKLTDTVKRTHARGRKLRFWAAPDRAEAWQALDNAGVDLINTDDLPGLSKFLREREAAKQAKETTKE